MIDLLYVSHNRLQYTQESFTALLENTNWEEVDTLFVLDDASADGTAQWLRATLEEFEDREVAYGQRPEGLVFHGERFGGPVAAMNYYLDNASPAVEMFAKVDNDMVVCPGWLDEMLRMTTLHPEVDILGMEPFLGDPQPPPFPDRGVKPCEHIGGKGLIRHRAFRNCRMVARGYFGFTGYQTSHPDIVKAWIDPDLPVFGLDQIREEDGPWRGLAVAYEGMGWQRLWPVYGSDEHYSWWKPAFA